MNSLWLETSSSKNYPCLKDNINADVCVVGAGICGITLAYLLRKSGLNVILLEKDKVCQSVTANTTGKITSQHGLFYSYLINQFGKDFAKKYLHSNEDAIYAIKEIVNEEQIDCDFEWQDAFIYTNSDEKLGEIKIEVENVKSLDFPASFCENTNLPFKTKGAICFPNQAQFNARRYCLGLLPHIGYNNVYENSKVISVNKENNEYITSTDTGSVKSKFVAITTHYPILNFPGFYFLKMYQDKSYLIATDTKSSLFSGMYISAEEPTLSFRTALNNSGNRLLLVGGAGHKTGDNSICMDDRYKILEDTVHGLYANSNVLYRWSTEDCVSVDKIPYIGEFSFFMPHVFVATGFKKWGMTSSYVAAKIISDEILGIDNPYRDIYSSTRFHPIQNGNETINMLKQTAYSLVLNRVTPPKEDFDDLKVGSGGIVNYNGKKLGIYRKSKDEIYAVSPYCTHLGCELSWNNLEKTWDCPCHGSRFDYTGKLLIEPSKKDLEKFEIKP